jgi:hypothetical protein
MQNARGRYATIVNDMFCRKRSLTKPGVSGRGETTCKGLNRSELAQEGKQQRITVKAVANVQVA